MPEDFVAWPFWFHAAINVPFFIAAGIALLRNSKEK